MPEFRSMEVADEITCERRGNPATGHDQESHCEHRTYGMAPPSACSMGTGLKQAGWNKKLAAELLGIHRRTLYRLTKRYGIPLGKRE